MQDIITNNRMYNLQMIKGDTFSFGIKLLGIGQDLDYAWLTCKASPSDGTAKFQKTLGNGIEKESSDVAEDTRFYKARIAPSDTSSLPVGRYYYDLKIGVNSDVFTLLTGILDIGASIGV